MKANSKKPDIIQRIKKYVSQTENDMAKVWLNDYMTPNYKLQRINEISIRLNDWRELLKKAEKDYYKANRLPHRHREHLQHTLNRE